MKGHCGKRVAVLGLLLAGSLAWAGIEWKQTRQEVRVAPGEGRARVLFRFRNTGAGAVTLERIAADCTLEVVEPDRRYRLVISPVGTADAFNVTVEIEIHGADAVKKVHQVFVSVK